MTSKTFCIYPWIHIYANPDGNVLPCCVADHHKPLGNLRTHTLGEVWNNDSYKNIRKKMLAGESCEECRGCYQQEAQGIESVRQSKNRAYEKHIHLIKNTKEDGSLDNISLRHFDVRWSNICNFKCLSCSSTYSSAWATEDNENGATKPIYILAGGINNEDLYKQFEPHFKDIETFYFAGGEPLLTTEHYKILKHLIDIGRTDVKLEYNTNLSVLRHKNNFVLDLWNQFSNVQINASIDSWGSRAEYIREGTYWPNIEDSIRRIKDQSPHVNLNTGSVISVFNVYTIPDFLEYMFDNDLFDRETYNPYFYNIINPDCYSANVLDDSIKYQIIDKLSNICYNENINLQIKKVITYIKNSKYNPKLRDEFLKRTAYYDKIRNRNFVETFPELFELYQ
jgi:radical SAM protein with 4Fe4S-binding SPASM domain